MKTKDVYTADFETRTIAPTKVWAWGISKINDPEYFEHGDTIDTFIEAIRHLPCDVHKIYFHNLKFDGFFILDYLLKNGYHWKKEKKDCISGDFTTVISGDGKFYLIDIYFRKHGKNKRHVAIQDSLKLLNMPVSAVAKTFNLVQQKGEIDYTAHDKHDFTATDEELVYLQNDVQIMSNGLQKFFNFAPNKMTIGSCALTDYKEHIGKSEFERRFPILPNEMDAFIRASYKGGFTAANEKRTDEVIHGGLVFDVNSLYPSVMYNCPLPYGEPIYFDGKYTPNDKYPLYVQQVLCEFKIKKNKIPIIQIKNSGYYVQTEYLKESNGETVLTLTSVDLELIQEHYDFTIHEYMGGYMFKASTIHFKSWIDKWFKVKAEATITKNAGLRSTSKLMLNNLYGKFGTNPKVESKYPVIEDNKVKLKKIQYPCYDKYGDLIDVNGKPIIVDDDFNIYDEFGNINPILQTVDCQVRDSVYIPVATFVTAWARHKTITTAQKIHEDSIRKNGISRWCYCDTDSIHIEGFEYPEGIDIHDTKLGYWAHESTFKRAKFLQAKRYIEDIYINDPTQPENKEAFENAPETFVTELKVTCSGLQQKFHKDVTFDNFTTGASFKKIVPKVVEGGVILVETEFTLKENLLISKKRA